MVNDRRRFWTALLFILLLVPAVITLLLTLFTPAPVTRGPLDRPNTNPLLAALPPRTPTAPAGTRANAPTFAAADGRHVWVAHPFQLPDRDGKLLPVFELLRRAGNTGVWARSTHHGALWRNFPRGVAVLPAPQGAAGKGFTPGVAYVFSDGGNVDRYTIDTQSSAENLPPGQILKATTGALQGVFAIAMGPPPTSATRPGDHLRPGTDDYSFADLLGSMMGTMGPGETPTTAPATTTRPATAPATAPAWAAATSTDPATAAATAPTTAPEPAAAPGIMNAYWLRENRWVLLPSLGQPTGDPSSVPTPSSLVAMVVQEGTGGGGGVLVAMWLDPTRAGELFVRTLALPGGAATAGAGGGVSPAEMAWSPPRVCRLPEQVPAVSRLFAVMLDGKICVLWTVPTGASVELRGGLLVPQMPAATGPAVMPTGFTFNAGRLAPMSLGTAGQGISPANDVAVGVSENSLLAVVSTKEGLSNLVFSDRGQLMAGPTAVEPKSLARDVRIGQNIATIILILVFSLSLWQWRQKSITMAVPADMIPAPLLLRGGAFLIDAAIPFLIAAAAFGELGNATSLLAAWFGTGVRAEELLHLPEFFVFIALLVTHCVIGELFFQRTLGKALVGLRVIMIDGKPPTLAAVLLRNVIRLPELAIPFVILYVLISENRQRLGDLLARTVVVAKKPPETPGVGDGGKSEGKDPPGPPTGG